MGDFELCCECDGETGRAGAGEDSLYAGDFGPYCENCWYDLPEKFAGKIIRLRADLAEAREALEPFAKLADAAGVQGCADDADWQIDLLGPRDGPAKGYIGDFTTADLRRARAFIDRGAC